MHPMNRYTLIFRLDERVDQHSYDAVPSRRSKLGQPGVCAFSNADEENESAPKWNNR